MDAKELKLYQAPETTVVNIESQSLLTASGRINDDVTDTNGNF